MDALTKSLTPEGRRYESAAWRVAYMATELSVAMGLVRLRTQALEERLRAAAGNGVPRSEAESMTYGLDGIDVSGMINRAYAGKTSP